MPGLNKKSKRTSIATGNLVVTQYRKGDFQLHEPLPAQLRLPPQHHSFQQATTRPHFSSSPSLSASANQAQPIPSRHNPPLLPEHNPPLPAPIPTPLVLSSQTFLLRLRQAQTSPTDPKPQFHDVAHNTPTYSRVHAEIVDAGQYRPGRAPLAYD